MGTFNQDRTEIQRPRVIAQSHKADSWQSQDLNPASPSLVCMCFCCSRLKLWAVVWDFSLLTVLQRECLYEQLQKTLASLIYHGEVGVACPAEPLHKQGHDVDKTDCGIVSWCQPFVWTHLFYHWDFHVLPWLFSFGHQSACIDSASVEYMVGGFCFISMPCEQWKSGL